MTYLRGNARISTLLAVTLTGAVLLGACAPATDDSANPQRRLQRTTTTIEWDTTTTTRYVPPTRTPEDVAYEYLMDEIPEWRRNTRADVEDLLNTVCDMLDDADGDFYTVGLAVVDASEGSFDLTYGQAGTVMGAAVIISCPEWQGAMDDYINS